MRRRRAGRQRAHPSRWGGGRGAFTLIELLVVIAILALLAALSMQAYAVAMTGARRAWCGSNLRQLNLAFIQYLHDSDGVFFKYRQNVPGGVQWYWGLESPVGGAEGSRPLDKSRAVLADYFEHGGNTIETCPALPYGARYFKRKFAVPSYGYAINVNMLDMTSGAEPDATRTAYNIADPSQTITWADAAQVNVWQAPASPKNPMLEEWYYLDGLAPPKYHFRHGRRCNVAFADGSVRALRPHALDARADGLTGHLEPPGQNRLLRLRK